MKKTIQLLLLSFFLSTSTAQTPLYLSFVSHNETTDPLDYDHPFLSVFYNQMRDLAKSVCDTIISKKAKINVQVDANFIKGALLYDDAANSTDDFLEWANNSPYIDVDGHNHFDAFQNPYNYADLAHLLDSCGVALNKHILGGVTWNEPTENWTQYESPVHGFTFTDFTWQADILWGPATPGHTNDYQAFGIWKPAGTSELAFGQHDPSQTLTSIGGGCKDGIGFVLDNTGTPRYSTAEIIANIRSTVDIINSNPQPDNAFYTANMLMNFRDMPNVPSFADSIATIIDGIQDYVDEGKIVWLTLAEKHDLWLEQHPDPADYFVSLCDDLVLAQKEEFPSQPQIEVYPNPTSGILQLRSDLQGSKMIQVLDLTGKILLRETMASYSKSIDLTALPNGIYFVFFRTENGRAYAIKCLKE